MIMAEQDELAAHRTQIEDEEIARLRIYHRKLLNLRTGVHPEPELTSVRELYQLSWQNIQ